MRILFDTNIVLDVLLKREPFAATAVRLFAAVEKGAITGLIAATTITTIFYLAEKKVGAAQARQEIGRLLTLFMVAPVDRMVLEQALQGSFADYEDAVLHAAAQQSGAVGIATRNASDFRGATLPIFSPPELLATVSSRGD